MEKQVITNAVIAVQNGDSSGWTVLDNEYRDQIYRFCLDKVKNTHEAEEITQQTIVTAFQNIGSLKNPKRFKPWVLTIANNKCTDYYRRIQKNMNFSSAGNEEADGYFDNVVENEEELYPEIHLDEAAQRKIIRHFIYNLPKEQAQCIELKYYQGLKGSEIASQLGINANTVRSRLRYGEANLKKQIQEYEKSTKTKLRLGAVYSYSNQLSGHSSANRRYSIPAVVAAITALVVAASVIFGVFITKNNSGVKPKPNSSQSSGKTLSESEILNNIAGKYLLTSNTVTGRSECIVNADGTVKGVYTDTVQKQSGSKYSSTVFESKWTGLLKNLKQINEYSYNFNISDIIYEHVPNTEKISNNVRTVYTEAKGMSEGSTLTVYTPETPESKLDSRMTSLPLIERSVKENGKLNSYVIVDLSEKKLSPYVVEKNDIKRVSPTEPKKTEPLKETVPTAPRVIKFGQ